MRLWWTTHKLIQRGRSKWIGFLHHIAQREWLKCALVIRMLVGNHLDRFVSESSNLFVGTHFTSCEMLEFLRQHSLCTYHTETCVRNKSLFFSQHQCSGHSSDPDLVNMVIELGYRRWTPTRIASASQNISSRRVWGTNSIFTRINLLDYMNMISDAFDGTVY